MGRLILLLFIILVVVMLWKAFGPGSRGNGMRRISAPQPEPRPLAPDDDPEFLWKLKKAEFDRRKREQELQERREREQRDQGNQGDVPNSPDDSSGTD
ncbi:hypothetical protein CRD19_01350 [Corynebacterium sp. LK32]|uniref:hypothetical protein n=1 Tax=Corynebacterium sp. LK32 TaxID=2044575 RepID=UPI0016523B43|nr:hypothetical protein [Corynebacterium sp. LK32]MBC6829078.1 hypothetical protein [Corynebacterium sp. LK32]